MEFTEEFIKENNLTPDQITAVKTFGTDYVATKQKEWEDSVKDEGNKYAEGILTGAASKLESVTGIKRDQGEKLADYTTRATELHLANKKSEIDALEKEYREKVKTGVSDEATKAELERMKTEIDRLKKIEADYEVVAPIKDKYESLEKEHGSLKLQTAFSKVRPAFPTTVNAYEASAKWSEFEKSILEKHTIEIVNGEPFAVDKENNHKKYKLSDLVSQDKNISELLKGRTQGGSGTTEATMTEIEGVPFKIKADASSEERSLAIREHLTKEEKLLVTSPEYSKRFAELNTKIRQGAAK